MWTHVEGDILNRRWGLRTEIIVHIVFLLAAALLFVGFILLKLAEREVLDARVSGAVQTMEALSLSAQDRELDFDRLDESVGVEAFALMNEDLAPVFVAEEKTIEPFNMTEFQRVKLLGERRVQVFYDGAWWPFVRDSERYVIATVPVLDGDRFLGALQGRFPLDDIRRSLVSGQKLVLVLVVLYGSVLVAAGVYLLGRNVVRPVRILADATRRVRSGNYEKMIDVEGPAEIHALAKDFNDMLLTLRQSRQVTEETIASLQRTNDQLSYTRQELIRSERLASVGHLAAGMAHELGNPLGAVVGYLELIKDEPDSAKAARIVESAQEELGRIDRLVRDLLDYAAPGNEEPEELDPGQVISDARRLLEDQGVFDSVQLEDDLPDVLPTASLPRHKLLQVFVNLLLNARDACDDQGVVRISADATKDDVRLSISDTGHGMSEETARHIFDPFYTTKDPGKGRGLGLAVCHRIVEEAGGRIDVVSREGEGSTFTVHLPLSGEG